MKFNTFLLFFAIGLLVASHPSESIAQTQSYLSDSAYIKHFNTLKNGVLLIRISDRLTMRQNLQKHGETEKLALFDRRLSEENREIYQAFAQNYNFGKILFFKKSETELLLSGRINEVAFVDVLGKPCSIEPSEKTNYLIGEFGKLNRPQRGPLIPGSNDSTPSETRSNFSAFYIMTPNFKPLEKSYFLFIRLIFKSKSGAIKKFNRRLQRNLKLIQP